MKGDKIKYYDGYKYQLAETYTLQVGIIPTKPIENQYASLSPDGVLTIREGYAWDGASGPTWDTPSSMRGGLVHDALYQLIRQGYLSSSYRDHADRLLMSICREDGMWHFRAWYWWVAVKDFAAKAALWESEPKIKEAP